MSNIIGIVYVFGKQNCAILCVDIRQEYVFEKMSWESLVTAIKTLKNSAKSAHKSIQADLKALKHIKDLPKMGDFVKTDFTDRDDAEEDCEYLYIYKHSQHSYNLL